jgi:membrane-associated phospholipid phosphatase
MELDEHRMPMLLRLTPLLLSLFASGVRAFAQPPSDAVPVRTTRASATDSHVLWTASSLLLAASLTFDERLRDVALAHHSASLDRLSTGADVLGTAGHLVPALVTTYVVSRALGRRSFAAATLRVGASYAVADAIEAMLKPTVGRVRPVTGREPLTFRPLTMQGDFHSFPSAHVVHITSVASAVAIEADRPWVTALASVAVAYVGAQRVYRDQHWSSDVVASAMFGVDVARRVVAALRPNSARR